MPRLHRRALLGGLLAAPALAAARTASAQDQPASLSSPQPTVAPLQPVPIAVRAPGYSGPAAIVLFDSRKRYAGTAEGQIDGGAGTITVVPRGALGPQWAALFLSGRQAAANPSLFTLDAATAVATGAERFDQFVPAVAKILAQSAAAYQLGGRRVRGFRTGDSSLIWLRDHVYQQRAGRLLDPDLRVTLDAFRDSQAPDGSLPDFLDRPEYQIKAFRTPVEADVEYLYVQGVFELWQATGDDGWLRGHLGAMRRALGYTLQSPLRWDAQRGVVKRPFTIDTWDFEVGPTTTNPTNGAPAPRHWIDDRTVWGAFHGDNTGLAQALGMMARIEDRVGDPGIAKLWRDLAVGVMANLNALAWNGSYYRHHVHFTPVKIPGLDEEAQLSLSNALALNRGVLTDPQGQAILAEYLRRGAEDVARYAAGRPDGAFAEWYSIDPPFPRGAVGLAGRSGEIPGEYINGGIMPLVGGELARGAFRYGRPDAGFAILELYWLRMLSRGRSFLWYRRDGAEGVGSDETVPYDGWGASAMLCALVEGAAGVQENGAALRDVTVAPRWGATRDVRDAYVVVRYPAGDGYVAYRWRQGDRAISLDVTGASDLLRIRIPLPEGAGQGKRSSLSVTRNGAPAQYSVEERPDGRYVAIDSADAVTQVGVSW